MVQDLKKENFDLKLRLYMEQKQNEVLFLNYYHVLFLMDSGYIVFFSFIENVFCIQKSFKNY